jgi:hypothetical protein
LDTLAFSHHLTFTPSPNFYMNTHDVQRLTNQHKMPAQGCTEGISLTADTSGNSRPNVSKYNRKVITVYENLTMFQESQEPNGPPREDARTYPETCGPYKDDGLEASPVNIKLPPAPQIPTVALPEEEDGSCSGSGSNLEGGLTGTSDGDPEAKLLGCLDDILPELLAISKTEVR